MESVRVLFKCTVFDAFPNTREEIVEYVVVVDLEKGPR